MNVWDIVKTVGTGAISALVPGGGAIIGAINAFLPDSSKLSSDATGQQAADAIQGLPASDRAAIMAKKFDVTITEIKESHSTVRAMLESDAKTPHTTRPYIAKGAFHVVAFTIISIVSVWIVSVYNEATETVKAIMDGWPFIVAVLAPLVTLLHAYFGVLKDEHKQKLDAANGVANPQGIAGMLAGMFGGKK